MPHLETRPDASTERRRPLLAPRCDTLPQRRQVRAVLASVALAGLGLACGDRRIDVALGAEEIPLQAATPSNAPSAPLCNEDPAQSAALEPNCEYSFDVQSCSATWSCDDGQFVTLTVAYGTSYGDFSCVTETHCHYDANDGQSPWNMDSCSSAPAEPIACPVATEADARMYCGPFVSEPVPPGCAPHDGSPSPSP